MTRNWSQGFKRGFVLLEILLVAVAILFLCYIALKVYVKKPAFDKATEKSLSEQGIDTSSQKAVLDSTKEKIKDVEKQIFDRERQLENIGY